MNKTRSNRSWSQKYWRSLLLLGGIFLLTVGFFFSTGSNKIIGDLTKAYIDKELTENALELAQQNERVTQLLGTLEPLDNMAILEGEVNYKNENKDVDLHVRVKGQKAKGIMDIEAYRKGDKWVYRTIELRIKNPPQNKETISVINSKD